MYEIPIAFIPKSFTDVFEKHFFSVLIKCRIANELLQLYD